MGWGKRLLLAFLLLILLVGVVGGYMVYAAKKGYTRAAFLTITSGEVMVDSGNGYRIAGNGMELGLNDNVKTAESRANIILYESVIVNVDPHTTVSISDLTATHPKVSLDAGQIWTKFTGLVGVENFDVQTPTTVATVRGTEYGSSHNDGVSEHIVAEGTVGVSSEGDSLNLNQYEKATKRPGEPLEKRALTPEEIGELKARGQRVLDSLKDVRMMEINKNKALLNIAKGLGVTSAMISDTLSDIDSGKQNEQDVIDQIPFETDSTEKVLAINAEIREQQAYLANLS